MARSSSRSPQTQKQVGYAVVGLGHIAQVAVLPAFQHAKKNSRLAALVSGDEDKRRELGEKYRVPTFDYDELETCLKLEDVDAVYLCTPNSSHAAEALQAARAGVHVLTEKPMATSTRDCQRMIQACTRAGVKLMVAYRLHFEAGNLETIQLIQQGRIGEPRYFTSEFGYQLDGSNIRTEAATGGGAIWDLGVYCINAARYLFRDEPTEVMAMEASGHDRRFKEVPEGYGVLLRFPRDRVASFTVNFGSAPTGRYRLVGTKGDIAMDPAYEYAEALERTLTVEEKKQRKTYAMRDQFAPEILTFSDCILDDREPEPSGQEGLADVRIIEAVLASARSHRGVRLPPFEKRRRPTLGQRIDRPKVRLPRRVHVKAPTS